MKYTDYPTMYQASDCASKKQQACHIRTVIIESTCVIVAAVSSGFFLIDKTSNQVCALITAVSLGGAFVARLLMKLSNWERDWYGTRAIAESIKTITWRYIMGISPYLRELTPSDLEQKLTSEIKKISNALPEIAATVSVESINLKPQTTSQRMTEIRNLPLSDRKDIYVATRVSNQREWYTLKSAENLKKANIWVCLILVSELVGMGIAFYLIESPIKYFNPLGLATTLTAILCAWAQTKRYQELAQAYGLAANEIASSEALSQSIQSEADLAKYVEEAEDAISREHTMWTAKRK